MSAEFTVPDIFTFTVDLGLTGNFDLNLDDLPLDNIRINNLPDINLNTGLSVNKLPPVNLNTGLSVNKLPPVNLDTGLSVDKLADINVNARIRELPKILLDMGLDKIRIKELAPINLQFSLKPAKLKLPFGYQFKAGLFGLNLIQLSLSGKAEIILDDLD